MYIIICGDFMESLVQIQNSNPNRKVQCLILLSEKEKKRLQLYAVSRGLTMSDVVRQALIQIGVLDSE